MSKVETDFRGNVAARQSTGLSELWLKEDWWAIWLGLGIVIVGLILFANGGSLRWIGVLAPKWTTGAHLAAHFASNWLRYVAQFVLWSAAFTVALSSLGHRSRAFLP